MVKEIWSKKAFGQLERAIKFHKKGTISYAEIVLNKVLKTTKLLETSPEMGPVEPLLNTRNQNTALYWCGATKSFTVLLTTKWLSPEFFILRGILKSFVGYEYTWED